MPEKNFWRPFFFWEHLHLCPWPRPRAHSCPWPREGLSSEGLSLALDFFLCPWPRALCPRLHLCIKYRRTNKRNCRALTLKWKMRQKRCNSIYHCHDIPRCSRYTSAPRTRTWGYIHTLRKCIRRAQSMTGHRFPRRQRLCWRTRSCPQSTRGSTDTRNCSCLDLPSQPCGKTDSNETHREMKSCKQVYKIQQVYSFSFHQGKLQTAWAW